MSGVKVSKLQGCNQGNENLFFWPRNLAKGSQIRADPTCGIGLNTKNTALVYIS